MAKFLQIEKHYRTGKIISYKFVTGEEAVLLHPFNMDLASWSKGARLNSRLSLAVGLSKFIYVRCDEFDEKDIEKLAGE